MPDVKTEVKTIEPTGTETAVTFSESHPCCWVINLGDSDLYASARPGIIPDADGVYLIPAGGRERITPEADNTIYVYGTGKAMIRGENDWECPSFRRAAKGGDEGIWNSYKTDGLIYQSGGIYKNSCNFPSDINLDNPLTVEFCGMYTNIPSTDKKGRWFEVNRYPQTSFSASQNNDILEIYYDGWDDWILDGETGITIAPNEYATISAIHTDTSLSLYKNGIFVKAFNATGGLQQFRVRTISFMYSEFRGDRALDGNVKSLRIYNRKLTDSEILHNANVDKSMYF